MSSTGLSVRRTQISRPRSALQTPSSSPFGPPAAPLAGYAGRWALEGSIVRHRLSFCTDPEQTGAIFVRHAELDEGMFTVRTPQERTAEGLVWLEAVWSRGYED